LWRRERSVTPTGTGDPDPPVRNLVATPSTLLRLLENLIYLIGGGGEIERKVNLGVLQPPVRLLYHLQKAPVGLLYHLQKAPVGLLYHLQKAPAGLLYHLQKAPVGLLYHLQKAMNEYVSVVE
jgi:hypothetical protein